MGEPGWKICVRKFAGEILRHVSLYESFERQFMAEMMQQQILLKTLEWAFGQNQVSGTKSSNHQQLGHLTPPRDGRDEIETRTIYPMQVLKDDYQPHVSGEGFQRFAQLADHAVPRYSSQLAFECRPILRADQRWKLN